jgi:ADP-ribose pyrophosphatase YjhB (NUDIX family)
MQRVISILDRHLEPSGQVRPSTSPADGMSLTVEKIKYCSKCGGALALRWIASDQRERRVCTACSHIHYENPRLLVSCFIHWRDRVVFCRRARAPARGLWALPAGFVEQGETLEEAVVREIEEETGLPLPTRSVTLFRLLSLPHINEVYAEFRAELTAAPVFSLGHEALEVALFSERDIPRRELAFGDVMPAYPDEFFKCLRTGAFPIRSVPLRPLKAT